MRFTKIEGVGWDTKLKNCLLNETKNSQKSVLTCYPNAYHVEDAFEK